MIQKKRFTHRGWVKRAALVAAVLLAPWSAWAANPDGDLRIEPIAAYNFVVDSNVESPSTYAPRAAYLSAKFHNDGTNAITNIWAYIGAEDITLPSIYYAHNRTVFERDGMLLAVHEYLQPREGERVFETSVRFRTVGDVTCTGCVESTAATVDEVIAETAVSRLTERGATRADDRISEAGMEDRKREGYF